jgi:geranylgeranyl reductase family protein
VTADVLVVGAGPAGSATAHFLARQGLDVLVLDRAHFPRPKACAEYLSPQASRILDALGVLTTIEGSGAAQLSGMRVRAPNGSVIHGEFAAAHGFHGFRDRGLALRRTELDPILLDAARRAGARVEEGARVTGLERDARGRVIGVETAAGVRRARLVIGADGLRSIVARDLGVARRSRFPRRLALVAHFTDVREMGGQGEMHVERDGYLGLADVGHGRTNVALVIPASQARRIGGDAAGYLEGWIASKPHLAPRFVGASRVSPVLATGPFAVSSMQAYGPGAALVGDAADFFDPFTGEGIYAALRGAELLAPFAVQAATASSARDTDAALAAYEKARRAEFRGKWRVERLIGTAVAFPPLMNRAAAVLSRRRDLADLLIGVAGDFVPPAAVLHPRFLLSLFAPRPQG